MGGKTKGHHCVRADAYTVVECPPDVLLGVPMVRMGATFNRSDMATALMVGFFPEGAVFTRKGVEYQWHDGALRPLNDDAPALLPQWRNGSKDSAVLRAIL